jgi:hypothetical protein
MIYGKGGRGNPLTQVWSRSIRRYRNEHPGPVTEIQPVVVASEFNVGVDRVGEHRHRDSENQAAATHAGHGYFASPQVRCVRGNGISDYQKK